MSRWKGWAGWWASEGVELCRLSMSMRCGTTCMCWIRPMLVCMSSGMAVLLALVWSMVEVAAVGRSERSWVSVVLEAVRCAACGQCPLPC